MLHPVRRQLLTQLESRTKPINPKDPRCLTPSGFVLTHGWWYESVVKPDNIPTGTKNECFANAFWLAFNDPSLIYCEGYALYDVGHHMTHHAWVTDTVGRAIDSTWDKIGVAYAGVPFQIDWLNWRHVMNKAIVCVLDDWQNGWPILCERGGTTSEWLEPRGRSKDRLTEPIL